MQKTTRASANNMPLGGHYRMPPDFAPSPSMMGEVGLDFDNDTGGLKKGAPPPPRPSRTWMAWAAVAVTALLIMAHPAYGLGVLHGAIIGGVAAMIWLEPGMAYGQGYR